MNTLDRADAYLTIPRSYGEALGLRWSHRRDAIERTDETTLVFAEELRSVLDGVFASPAVPPFAFVVSLLDAMKRDRGPDFEPLRRAFEQTRGGVGRRNVGLLIGELCRGLPPAAGELTGPDVATALQFLRLHGEHARPDQVPEPPLTPSEFERGMAARLSGFTDDDLRQWLTHGTGPSPAGKQLADEIEPLPMRVARLVALARRRPRLVGAAALVPAIDAAFSLPPRRRSPDAPPQGGYCDVTTRGDPERLLPAQFALDPDEFVRRFAASELLYFQREEPHQAEQPERVIVLDQGVRTWGSVRLALSAAAVSLLNPNAKRCGRVRLFVTSTHAPTDLAEREAGALADHLEASDLTANPARCLRHVLHTPEGEPKPRDVILLTHPRSLREPEVIEATHPLPPSDRLFALAVNDDGRAEVVEWKAGGPVPVRSFRVNLVAAEAARVEQQPAAPRPLPGAAPEWAGDCEPVPFPFRPGLVAEPVVFGFAADGDWLVVAGRNGVLHGITFDGSPPAVLPRAYHNGVVLTHVSAILGVTGGVVVCGRMAPGRDSGREQFVAAHYDRVSRRVAVHFLGPSGGTPRWTVQPDLHCVAVRSTTGWGCAIDLATRGRFPGASDSELVSRARTAWDRSEKQVLAPHELPLVETIRARGEPFLTLLPDHSLGVWQAPKAWSYFKPQRDGRPLLAEATIHRAQLAGNVLALSIARSGERKLVLFRGPEGVTLGELSPPVEHVFSLSADGKFLARRDATRALVVSETADPARPLAAATHAALHNALDIRLDAVPFQLVIAVGTFAHTFRLFESQLRYTLVLGWDRFPTPKASLPLPEPQVRYDAARFPAAEDVAAGRWRAVLDRLGQVLLYAGGELVAAFAVRRERAAAWIPGGVFWGEPTLIGGPPTPGADKKIGAAIRAAGG